MVLEYIIPIAIIFFFMSVKVVMQYDRLVRFRLGKFKDVMQPGLQFVIPFIDIVKKVDIRVTTEDIPRQEAMTRDNVPLGVDAVIFFKVVDPNKAINRIDDYRDGVSQYARTALRDVVGKMKLDEILIKREELAEQIKNIVDDATENWGVDILSVRIQNVELPDSMKRAMARQAEAEREKRATIIKSEGEVIASVNLTKAALTLQKAPLSIHLRTLETLSDISSDPSQKIIFALPLDIMQAFANLGKK